MSIEYRQISNEDYEAIARLESRAFYGTPQPGDADLLRQHTKPEWTVAAYEDGKPVASVRTIPMTRFMFGSRTRFGAISPVACEAAYRRQGHVARLLTMSLELMREREQPISGLYTPHDGLYRRYGWERSEQKRRLRFDPGDIKFRLGSPSGRTVPGSKEDWERLDRIYMKRAPEANGRMQRSGGWWQWAVLTDYEPEKPVDRDIVIWIDASGEDAGYAIYQNQPTGNYDTGWPQQQIWVHDMTALDQNAYLGLWSHFLTHDLAERVVFDAHPQDPFQDLCEDPFAVKSERAEGPMIRMVDVESALGSRPFTGSGTPAFTMRIADESAPWNEGVWRVEAGEGKMRAEKTEADPDIELDVNFLAPLYTGFRSPQLLASVGMITVHNAAALPAIAEAFAVPDPPYVQDYY